QHLASDQGGRFALRRVGGAVGGGRCRRWGGNTCGNGCRAADGGGRAAGAGPAGGRARLTALARGGGGLRGAFPPATLFRDAAQRSARRLVREKLRPANLRRYVLRRAG